MNSYTMLFKGEKPLYIELSENIKNDIIKHVISENEKMPSKRKLANMLGISVNTVLKAYDILVDEGFITSIEKKGYFVTNLNITVNQTKIIKEVEIKNEFQYNFKTNNIDSSLFPKKLFKKLYSEEINNASSLKRSSYKGSYLLRESLASYLYEVKGILVNPNNIILQPSTDILLERIIKLLNIKSAYIENPCYQKYIQILRNNNIDITYGEIDKDGLLPPDKHYDLIITTPYNQFPTGVKMSIKRKNEILAKAKDSIVIEDSFDSDFKLTPSITTSFYDLSNNVIYLESFSRTVGPFMRISFMILPDFYLKAYENFYSLYGSSISSLEEAILARCIQSGEYLKHINRLRTLFRKKREIILSTLDLNTFDIISKENYLSVIVKPKKSITNIKEILKCNGIDISFMSDFSKDNTRYNNELIIGYSEISLDKIKDGIILLNSIFK